MLRTFEELRADTLKAWEYLYLFPDCYVPGENAAYQEIGKYGSLEDEETWVKAWIAFTLKNLQSCLAVGIPSEFVELQILWEARTNKWEDLLPQVIEEAFQYPEIIREIKEGIHQIRETGSDYGTPDEVLERFVREFSYAYTSKHLPTSSDLPRFPYYSTGRNGSTETVYSDLHGERSGREDYREGDDSNVPNIVPAVS